MSSLSERQRRVGLNEATWRQVNEELEGLNKSFSQITHTFVIVCECGNNACEETISIAPEEYHSLRAESEIFAVVPGHEYDDVEDVVERRSGYDVVRKREGGPAELARATDASR